MSASSPRPSALIALAIPDVRPADPEGGETLFRGNTLLSKTLEATMRSFCHDFLVRSIGPTIDRVLTEGLALSLHVTTQANGLVVLQDESLEGMRELVRDCWEDMYRMLVNQPERSIHAMGVPELTSQMLEMLFQSMFAGL